MYKILRAEELTTNIYLMVVEAKRVAKHCLPGQFLIVRTGADSERIPLTICDYDRENGTVTIVFQIVGGSTVEMAGLKAGDSFHDVVGPLGCASELCEKTKEELDQARKDDAYKNIKASLVVNKIMNVEGLVVTKEVLDAHYAQIASQYNMSVEDVRKTLEPNKEAVIRQLGNKIFTDFMLANN